MRQEKDGSLIIKKPACQRKDGTPVILQGHLDMVYVKDQDSGHQYQDGIQVLEDEKDLYAKGTPLGADNGIGVAFCMALMDSQDIPHPDLEFIFTIEEEVGLAGAARLDISDLRGRPSMRDWNASTGVTRSRMRISSLSDRTFPRCIPPRNGRPKNPSPRPGIT